MGVALEQKANQLWSCEHYGLPLPFAALFCHSEEREPLIVANEHEEEEKD
jgi:hypothetical protein